MSSKRLFKTPLAIGEDEGSPPIDLFGLMLDVPPDKTKAMSLAAVNIEKASFYVDLDVYSLRE
jgi:hypothetical protein